MILKKSYIQLHKILNIFYFQLQKEWTPDHEDDLKVVWSWKIFSRSWKYLTEGVSDTTDEEEVTAKATIEHDNTKCYDSDK